MSGNRKKKKNGSFIGTVMKTIVIIGVIALIIYLGSGFVKKKVEDKAAEVIVNQMAASDTTLPDGKSAKDVYDSMSNEDKEKVQAIVDDHLDAKTASDIQSYVTSGDTEGLKDYAEQNLSDEEQQELLEMYNKYK